ncbi:MAG: ankyrin repeat domain-containing protein [Pseudoxanthomonas mexicana]|nr:ankyrin repeat domain-containing protein [Pseudoxanthomonas mexicana]
MNEITEEEVDAFFADVVNYDEDPLAPINPLTYKTPEGDSCLHIAAARGNERVANYLIDRGLDVNSVGDMGSTPLHYAYMFGTVDVQNLLIRRGARSDVRNEFGLVPGDSK